jgi:hypothetical protein
MYDALTQMGEIRRILAAGVGQHHPAFAKTKSRDGQYPI